MQHPVRRHIQQRVSVMLIATILLASTLGASAAARPATMRHLAVGPRYGGTIEVAFTSDVTSFDPSQAYSIDWFIMNGTLFNGLYQYDRRSVPQLDLAATPPTISPDRKMWTFTLRKGVLFSNGIELTADDVKYSILRTLSPHTKPAPSWGQFSEPPFVGAAAFIAGKTTDVPGIQVLGRYTIRFVLAQPTALFPYIMAESFNMVVPKAVVQKEGDVSFADHPIGTGPYILRSWDKGTKLVFVRNPHYFHTGKPYIDKIIVDLNVPSNLITLKIEKGDVTGFGRDDQMDASDLQQARGDPRYASYLHDTPLNIVDWLEADVKVPPLNNPMVRQAIAMAINRAHLVQLLGGQAVAAGQLYAPVDPQHDPTLDRHPVYPYDPQKAAALLKSSGYHGQPVSLLYSNNYTYENSMAPGIQQDLQHIGLNVTLRGISHTSLIALRGKYTGHQLSTDLWSPDFNDAADVYAGVLACGANGTPGNSGAHYCDPTADALVTRASTLSLGPDRDALLRQAQRHILQAAAEVPLVFIKTTEMVSPKVGGFYYEPLFGWQYENYWLNP